MPTRSKTRDGFHYFPQLPAELRQEIWSYCLPYRVCQIDLTLPELARSVSQSFSKSTCRLSHTTNVNKLPPVLARVCRESRHVAFRTGRIFESKDRPCGARYASAGSIKRMWQDPKRDVAHLNWAAQHSLYWEELRLAKESSPEPHGDQIACLQWHASQLLSPASLMVEALGYQFPPKSPHVPRPPYQLSAQDQRELDSLKKVSRVLIVMRTIIIHAPVSVAVETECFGLLGDAPVQVVDVAEQAKIDALFHLAETSENQGAVDIGQDLERGVRWSVEAMEHRLRGVMNRQYYDDELTMRVRPAIMFRLCTQNCNDRIVARKFRRSQAQKKRRRDAKATRIIKP